MKEDILEQIVDNWLLSKPSTFTKSNLRYKPAKEAIAHLEKAERGKYTVSSDIDILSIELLPNGVKNVSVVNCKSWQHGFNVTAFYDILMMGQHPENKKVWKHFREFVNTHWATAFREKIISEINCTDVNLTYYIAVTKLTNIGKKENFENEKVFLDRIRLSEKTNVTIQFIDLQSIVKSMIREEKNTTLESTEMGRLLQLISAANLSIQ